MRVVVGGAGAIGASIAYQLALRGARDVVLCDRGDVAGESTARAMGGVRQQFSTAAEVRLAQESIRFFEELGPPYFHQVGYLFLATSEEGREALEERLKLQRDLGVPVQRVDPSFVPGLETGDVLGAVFCAEDGVADPAGVAASSFGARPSSASTCASARTSPTWTGTCGCWPAGRGRRR